MLVITAVLLVLVLGAAVAIATRVERLGASLPVDLDARMAELDGGLKRIEAQIDRGETARREDARRALEAARETEAALRDDVTSSLKILGEGLRASIGDLAALQRERLATFEALLNQARANAAADSSALRDEMRATLAQLGDAASRAVRHVSETQDQRLDGFARMVASASRAVEAKQEALRQAIDARLDAVEQESARRLDQLRSAIAGELQGARDLALFNGISRTTEALELALKALGETQNIAAGRSLRVVQHNLDFSR
jgi:DNA recombination protein RmuC